MPPEAQAMSQPMPAESSQPLVSGKITSSQADPAPDSCSERENSPEDIGHRSMLAASRKDSSEELGDNTVGDHVVRAVGPCSESVNSHGGDKVESQSGTSPIHSCTVFPAALHEPRGNAPQTSPKQKGINGASGQRLDGWARGASRDV